MGHKLCFKVNLSSDGNSFHTAEHIQEVGKHGSLRLPSYNTVQTEAVVQGCTNQVAEDLSVSTLYHAELLLSTIHIKNENLISTITLSNGSVSCCGYTTPASGH